MSRARRKGNVVSVDFSPVSGVNYGVSPIDLQPDELASSVNGYYPRKTRKWTVRPPLSAVTSDGNSLASPILKAYSYYNGTTQYLVCASGGKLYAMTKAVLESTPVWTEVGSLTDSTTKPSFHTFNGLLVIADGGTALRYWDGTTYSTLANSPSGATALTEIRNRLVCNSSNIDEVNLSTAEFTGTDFDQGSGSISLKAGFGDGIAVNAFSVAPGGNALVVSKANNAQGEYQLRLLDVSSITPTDWRVSDPFVNKEAAQNAHGILTTSNSVFFFDETGIKRVEPTDQYGNLQSNPIFGDRINDVFSNFTAVVNEITYLPTLTAFMLLLDGHPQQYLYFPRNNAWCPWRLSELVINTVTTIDEEIYLAGANGILYKLDESKVIAADELSQGGATANIKSSGTTKRIIDRGYDIKLRRTAVYLKPERSGSLLISAITGDGSETKTIDVIEFEGEVSLLGLADGLLGEADELFGADSSTLQSSSLWGGPRSNGIQLKWMVDGATYELNYISSEFEGPLGG